MGHIWFQNWCPIWKIVQKNITYIKFSSSNSSWRSNLYEPLQYVQDGEYDLESRKWNLLHL
jgi:hypothetical protein